MFSIHDISYSKTIAGIMLSFLIVSTFGISPKLQQAGFVSLHDIDSTIRISARYATHDNFMGKPIIGYHDSSMIVLTKEAAYALKKAQEEFLQDGYCLVVYDAYRPQFAVDSFVSWVNDSNEQSCKPLYFPRVDKATCCDDGYIARRSGHTRGSTIDLTIMEAHKSLHQIIVSYRKLNDGFTIPFLDDGTLDMGSSFDLFDPVSRAVNNLIDVQYQERRNYLKRVLEKHGFKQYAGEWWHFTLRNEPYPANQDASYFNEPMV